MVILLCRPQQTVRETFVGHFTVIPLCLCVCLHINSVAQNFIVRTKTMVSQYMYRHYFDEKERVGYEFFFLNLLRLYFYLVLNSLFSLWDGSCLDIFFYSFLNKLHQQFAIIRQIIVSLKSLRGWDGGCCFGLHKFYYIFHSDSIQ